MDRYGQIGPDKGDYDEDCQLIAGWLRRLLPVFVKLAAEGTGFEVALIPVGALALASADESGKRCYPAGTQALDGTVGTQLLVVIRDKGSAWFDTRLRKAPPYIAEKFGYSNPIDPASIADFLDRVGRALHPDEHESIVGPYETRIEEWK